MASGSSRVLRGEIVSSATQPENERHLYSIIMNSMRERVGKLSHTNNEWSIFRVPSRLRELNEDAYTPRIVSIGPIHQGNENLRAMDVHKIQYMQSIFLRTTDPEQTFSKCLKEMQNMEERACSYYSEGSSAHQFVADTLLMDGCFLLELFLIIWNSKGISNDTILGATTIYSLQRDLALLENQIPFFVLERLFELITARIPQRYNPQYPKTLGELCASFFYLELNSNQSSSDSKHLLDLIRNCHLPRQYRQYSKSDEAFNCCGLSNHRTEQRHKQSWELIPCITKLRESGIKFVKGTSANLFDIKFTNGVLEIPELCITDTMDSLLRNMIAFEQCFEGTTHHITSYAVLMDCLIDSPADAEFLQHKRIIKNYLGHGEEVSNIFNKISKKVFVENFYFGGLCHQVNDYCNLCWPRRRESFVRYYCFSPWKFIGVVAGFILLLLTVIQTGYTVASYYPHPT